MTFGSRWIGSSGIHDRSLEKSTVYQRKSGGCLFQIPIWSSCSPNFCWFQEPPVIQKERIPSSWAFQSGIRSSPVDFAFPLGCSTCQIPWRLDGMRGFVMNGEDLNHVNDPIFKTHLKLNVKFNGEDHHQPTWGFEHWKEMIHRRFSIVIKTGEFHWTFCCLGNGRKMFSPSMLWAIAWKDYGRIATVNQMELTLLDSRQKIAWQTRLFKTAVLQSVSTGWYTAGASH